MITDQDRQEAEAVVVQTGAFGEPWRESPSWDMIGTVDGQCIIADASAMSEPHRSRAIECVNACAGINPEAVPMMREALEDAHNALGLMRQHLDDLSESNPGYLGKLCLQDYGLMNEAFLGMDKSFATSAAALAKAKEVRS